MHKSVSVLYNASGDARCYNATQLQGPAGPGATWLFQWCTQRSAQELPYFPANGAACTCQSPSWAAHLSLGSSETQFMMSDHLSLDASHHVSACVHLLVLRAQ